MALRRKKRTPRRTSIQSANAPNPQEIYQAALAYRNAGLSIIPIASDGTKRPASHLLPSQLSEETGRMSRSWKGFMINLATREQIDEWFKSDSESTPKCGIGVIAGKVSGNLEILDIDSWDYVERVKKRVDDRAPGLWDRLVRVVTPRPGLHLYYRCPEIGHNQKLAGIQDPGTTLPRKKVVIETRGEGGYVIAPPAPSGCHPSGRLYRFDSEIDLREVPTITPEERRELLDAARRLNTWESPRSRNSRHATREPQGKEAGNRPGDDFNERGNWNNILEPHGWTFVSLGPDGVENWRRPGKQLGSSATVDYMGNGLLHVFSTNAHPFEPDSSYTKFAAFALLNHDDNYQAAAADLREKGYGKPKRERKTRTPRFIREVNWRRQNPLRF